MVAYSKVTKVDADALTASHWNALSTKVQALDDGTGPTVKLAPVRYTGSSAPVSPREGDLWADTTQAPIPVKMYVSGAWVLTGFSSGGAGTDIPAGMAGVPGLAGLTWAPALGRNPVVTNFTALRTVTVTTSAQWISALSGILPGDDILVTVPMTSGWQRTITNKNGSATNPWRIRFAQGVTWAGNAATHTADGGGFALDIRGCSYFILQNITLTQWNQGVWIRTSSNFYLDSCFGYDFGRELFHPGDNSSYGDFFNCGGRLTGLLTTVVPFGHAGEVFYVGNDENNWNSTQYVTNTGTGVTNAGKDLTNHMAFRECYSGKNISSEFAEFKSGTSFCYLIGCAIDGRGYTNEESSGNDFARGPVASKGDDSFYYWNKIMTPNRSGFHSYGANSAKTLGGGSYGQRHTYFGNQVFMDASDYTGTNVKQAITVDTGKSPIVYDNNRSTGGVSLTNATTTATPAGA